MEPAEELEDATVRLLEGASVDDSDEDGDEETELEMETDEGLTVPALGVDGMYPLMQTIEPTCTVLVDSRLGLVLLKGRPAVPVPLEYLKGVHVIESTGTLFAPERKR